MDWMITTTVLLSVLNAALCYNVEPAAWRFLADSAAGFGYQVVQRSSDLLVSAPLAQYTADGRGQIFQCSTSSCRRLPVQLPEFAVNASLGLTMTSDPATQKTMVCGPTIPNACPGITRYKGVCIQIDHRNRARDPVPSSLEECKTQLDIAFLLDGSGSLQERDFQTMKSFVQKLISAFLRKDTRFAIAQFSFKTKIHYYFNTFNTNRLETQIRGIRQLYGGTFTAAAIKFVVQNVFSTSHGSRPNVKKILIVITDGQSEDRYELPEAIKAAADKEIVRFAVGVGYVNIRELDLIASPPSTDYVFQVKGFDALEKIRTNLEDKIFAIEGTGGESLQSEMSQEGFSAAYVPEGIQMATVGANLWTGGYLLFTSTGAKTGVYGPTSLEPDSYLGYSMAVAKTERGSLTVLGAPRYQHRGIVMTVQSNGKEKKIEPFLWQFQIGEYFGAEVCTMDVDRDTYTDLIFISAPMYIDSDGEGRVYVCSLDGLDVECYFDNPSVLRGQASAKGRFGSSLAALPDLNSDDFDDLVVGAPLENDGQGSIYIFNGEGRGRISLAPSQRIAGFEVQSGLRFFGISISKSSYDLSLDGLPDLAVGSKGRVVLLRSKPVVMVEAKVSFSPHQIPTQKIDCSRPLENTATICFTMTTMSLADKAQARINYTLTLDGTRNIPNHRAYISERKRVETRLFNLDSGQRQCFMVNFYIQACPADTLNELSNELRFTFDGLPSQTNLRPSLARQAQTTSLHPLRFEISCGADNKCTDNLQVDLSFTSSLAVRVGIDELLDVNITVENSEENSYNSRVILTYPAGLSFRKFTALQGRVACDSMDSEDDSSRGKTDCAINKPVFKSNTTAFFVVSYGIEVNSRLGRKIFVTANATSANEEHSISSKLYKKEWIDVKYSILVTIKSSFSYNNFTFGRNNLQKPVKQSIEVTNEIRAFNVTVVIRVPVKLGDKEIWVDSNSLLPECQRDQDEVPAVMDFIAEIQRTKLVDCAVAQCKVFKCSMFMGRLEIKQYTIYANLSSGWTEQIGLQSAKFLLTSTVSLEYDRDQFVFASTRSDNIPPVHKIVAEVEVYSEPNFTKEIVGGFLGGLVLLAMITIGLYKVGFFKSKLAKMIEASEGVEGELGVEQ